ncbi:hypothetical protein B0H10DRAFT_1946295 [Mycena sp. CBHHK59/15]|nr:hypothetical protein B0H10DRAFT_1946295 [Mycena sp. CBHHK59/15]
MPPFAPRLGSEDPDDSENSAAILQRCRRHIAELEAQLMQLQGVKKAPTSIKSFTGLSHCIHKVISTFDSVQSLITENDRRQELAEAHNESESMEDEEEEPTLEFVFSVLPLVHTDVQSSTGPPLPWLPGAFALTEANHDEGSKILAALHGVARGACSDDTKNLCEAIVPWIHQMMPDLDPKLDPASCDNHGLYHDTLSTFLCPIEDD